MSQLITYGNEMLRINTQKNTIEFSTNGGRSWLMRFSGTYAGTFCDLFAYGDELLACTSKGVYYSTNKGSSWLVRFSGTYAGSFLQLSSDGKNLLATTSKGLYYSTNKGASWLKK